MVLRLFGPRPERENGPMKALIFTLLTFLPFLVHSQVYRMTGDFSFFTLTSAPIRANFTLIWNESDNYLEGRYSDNVLVGNAGATGTILNGKRTFSISLPTPDPRHGVKTITIETSDVKGMSTNVNTTVTVKDLNGVPLQSSPIFAQIRPDSESAMQAQQYTNCSAGFGLLTGFCGVYSGNFAEEQDLGNVCQLVGAKLELADTGDLNFYFNYSGTFSSIPKHSFGSILGGPLSRNINLSVRHCGHLPATTMNSAGCQDLHLVGAFQEFGLRRNFAGTYDIRDEVTGNTCRYSFNFYREDNY